MGEHGNAAPPPPGPEPVDQLLREGSASYLDALYALHRFKREVFAAATEVWQQRSPGLAEQIGVQAGPSASYCKPGGVDDEGCDGNWAWITCKSCFAAPLEAFCCHLGLSFEREQNGRDTSCEVTFLIQPGTVERLQRLEKAFRDMAHFWTQPNYRECGFSWPLENIDHLTRTDLVRQFHCMMNHVIGLDAWRNLGD